MVGIERGRRHAIAALAALVCVLDARAAERAFDSSNEWWNAPLVAKDLTRRRLTVEDAIRFATLGDPGNVNWMDHTRVPATYSPRGSRVATIVRRGNLQTGRNDGVILMYRVSALPAGTRPERAVEFSSSTNSQPVSMLRWLDEETLLFAATDGAALSQVYRLDVASGKLHALTREATQLMGYEVSRDGTRLVTAAVLSERAPPLEAEECYQSGCRVTARDLWEARTGRTLRHQVFGAQRAVYDLSTGRRWVLQPPEDHHPQINLCGSEYAGGVSPDGRFAVQSCQMRSWPAWWHEYRVDAAYARELQAGYLDAAHSLFLIDLTSGESRPLTGAPLAFRDANPTPLWIDDGQRLVLAGAFEPLADVSDDSRSTLAQRAGVLVIEVATGNVRRIASLPPAFAGIISAEWDDSRQTVSVHGRDSAGNELERLAWRRRAERWSAVKPKPAPSNTGARRVRLTVEQSPNRRPVLIAESVLGGARSTLLDPNGWLEEVELGRVEPVSWTARGGRSWSGMLYYPPAHDAQRLYPLVIQTHHARADQFSLDGYARVFAAQPLAARDMMVLQVQDFAAIRDVYLTPPQWPAVQQGYEAAIDHLAQRKLIDRDRVGIVGWSRTGPHVGYTLTHSDYPFGAAMIMDALEQGWTTYQANETPISSFMELDYGGRPYGTGLEAWLELAPSFNLERVRSPVMLWMGRTGSIDSLWDWYAGLRRMGKPVEYWLLPGAEHDPVKISERLRANGLLVDWFNFWLAGEEDPAPVKQKQYERWRTLRQQQLEVEKNPRPQLLDWSSRQRD